MKIKCCVMKIIMTNYYKSIIFVFFVCEYFKYLFLLNTVNFVKIFEEAKEDLYNSRVQDTSLYTELFTQIFLKFYS